MKAIRGILQTGPVLLLATVLPACSESAAVETASGSETAAAERRTLEVKAEAAGLIEPIRVIEVKSKASGEVLKLYVETGDRVERGALLAEVDPRDVRNALAQAEADLEVARARLATSEAQRARSEQLRESNVITEQEYEATQLDEANARAQFIKARTNHELAQERMSDVTIRAPLNGTVIQKTVEVGQIIQSASQNISGGTTLLLMADLAEMQVRTLVDETDIGRIAPGLPAQVSVEAFPNRTFAGTVLKIEPQAVVEQNVTMFPVLVRLENREGLLKPGMNAEVQIQIARRENVVTVPNAAVVVMRDAAAAGAVLGLDEDALRATLRGGWGGARAGAPAGDQAGAAPTPDSSGAKAASDQAAASGAAPDECQALRERMRAGGRDALTEADRTKARECFQRQRDAGADSGAASADDAVRPGEMRPGVIFVQGAAGPEPRMVVLGLNDWDSTEIVRGIEEGERVILMSLARLQQQQQQMLDRIRERNSGPFPGASGRRR